MGASEFIEPPQHMVVSLSNPIVIKSFIDSRTKGSKSQEKSAFGIAPESMILARLKSNGYVP